MAMWNHTISLKDEWAKFNVKEINDSESLFLKAKKAITDKLKADAYYDRELFQRIVTELDKTEDIDEFNDVWDSFYDYCDVNKIWISTTI